MGVENKLASLIATSIILSACGGGGSMSQVPVEAAGTPAAAPTPDASKEAAMAAVNAAATENAKPVTPGPIKPSSTETPTPSPTATPEIEYVGGAYPEGFLDAEGVPVRADVKKQIEDINGHVENNAEWFYAVPGPDSYLQYKYFIENNDPVRGQVKTVIEISGGSDPTMPVGTLIDFTAEGMPVKLLSDPEATVTWDWLQKEWVRVDSEGAVVERVVNWQWVDVEPAATATPEAMNRPVDSEGYVTFGNVKVKASGEYKDQLPYANANDQVAGDIQEMAAIMCEQLVSGGRTPYEESVNAWRERVKSGDTIVRGMTAYDVGDQGDVRFSPDGSSVVKRDADCSLPIEVRVSLGASKDNVKKYAPFGNDLGAARVGIAKDGHFVLDAMVYKGQVDSSDAKGFVVGERQTAMDIAMALVLATPPEAIDFGMSALTLVTKTATQQNTDSIARMNASYKAMWDVVKK